MNPRTRKLFVTIFALIVIALLLSVVFIVSAATTDLDATFDPGAGANDNIYTIVQQPDGKILIGGAFTSYNNTSRNHIARLNSDGSLDTSFDPGTGTNGDIYTIVLKSDGKIFIGGAFTSYNNSTRNFIAMLNSNGSLDTGFDTLPGPNALVTAAAADSFGNIIIGGNFSSYDGHTQFRHIARINYDGSLGAYVFDPGTGTDGNVLAIAVLPNDQILIGGDFTSYNGTTCGHVARLKFGGDLDTSFNSSTGANGRVSTITLQSDGKAIIGGVFTSYNTTSRNHIARVNTDGTLDTTFNPGAGADGNGIYATAVQPNGQIIIGGDFIHYNNASRNYIARLSSTGALDTSFNFGTGPDNDVHAVAVESNVKVVFGGKFTHYDGRNRNHIARRASGDICFSDAVNYTTGGNFSPKAVTVADFNGDGKPDIASDGSSTVSILLNNGQGGFGTATDYTAGFVTSTTAMAAGDFDGNGYPDLIVTGDKATYGVTVMLNDGAGAFTSNPYTGIPNCAKFGVTPPCIDNATSIAVGDFNADGKLDAVVSNGGGASLNLIVLKGDGAGSFSSYTVLSPGGGNVVVRDINGDSKLDIVVGTIDSIYVFLGNGDGTFQSAISTFINDNAQSLVAADFDGDGKLDVAVPNTPSGGYVAIYRGDGAGHFTFGNASFIATNYVNALAASDLNGDGKQDLIGGTIAGTFVLLGDGTGDFTPATNVSTETYPNSFAVGDFNGDGGKDIAVGNYSVNVSVLLQCPPKLKNTPVGLNVLVDLGNVIVKFAQVTGEGDTTAVKSTRCTPVDPCHLPDGYTLYSDLSYNVSTTATYTGSIKTSIFVGSNVDQQLFDKLRVLHEENGVFVDVTIPGDPCHGFNIKRVCGLTTSLSPFVVAVKADPTSISSVSGSGTFNGAATLTATLTSNNAALGGQTISFTLNGNVVGTAATNSSGVAKLSGVSLSGINAGTYSNAIGASFAGTADYLTSSGSGNLTVSAANQTINVTTHAPSSAAYNSQFTVAATASSGLPVTYSSSGACTNTGATFTMTSGTGTCTVLYNQAGNSNYNAAAQITESVTAQKVSQVITFNAPANKTYGDADFQVSASASSGLSVSFAAAGNCSVTGNTVHLTGAGSCTINASQAGDSNYSAATSVQQTFSIAKAVSATTVTSSLNPSKVGQSVTFTATVTSTAGMPTGTVQFKDNGTNIGSPLALNGSGVATISTSTLAAGNHTITVDYSGDANFLNSTGTLAGGQQVNVNASLSINDVSLAEGNSGTKSFDFTVTLSPASNQQVKVDYATANGTANAGSDYQALTGTLTFNIGETQKTITVLVNGDTVNEPNETFFVNLSTAVNASISDNQGQATILNDDSPVIQLASNAYSFSEAAGHGDLIVTRSGDLSIPISVDYQSSDQSGTTPCQTLNTGIASVRCDYATAAGTLSFAAGEAQKVIPLIIINDAYVEGPEQLFLKLSNPIGASLGSVDTATITILDDDTQQPTQNPVDSLDFFLRELYIDFLGREPEPAGFQFWKDRMTTNCPAGQTCDRIDTALRFFSSDEFKERGFFVYLFYHAGLGHPPLYSQWIMDVSKLNGPKTVAEQEAAKEAFVTEFIAKQEFISLYNSAQTGQTFVDALIQKSGVTPASRQQLINNYQSVGRAKTLRAFIETPEVQDAFRDRAFVSMLYFGLLRRDPEAGGFSFWMQQLNNTSHDYRFLMGGFLQSDEFRFRFAFIPAH